MTTHDEFDRQWHARTLRVGGDSVDFYEAVPERERGLPVIICPGWLERPASVRAGARALFERGRRVLLVDTAQSAAVRSPLVLPPRLGLSLMPVERRKAAAVRALFSGRELERVDIVAHSEGALYALALAAAEPSRVRRLVLVNPAGLLGVDSAAALCGRFLRELMLHGGALAREAIGEEAAHSDQLRHGSADFAIGAFSLLAHPFETYRSVRAIATANLGGVLPHLRERGVELAVIHGAEDRVFPNERMKAHVKGSGAVFMETQGSHVWYLLEPRRYGEVVGTALDTAS